MEQYLPLAIAAIAAFIVWKIFAGVVKFLLIAGLLCGAAYVYWYGLLDGLLK